MATATSVNVPIEVENKYDVAADTEYAILFDASKCTACKGCQAACKLWNNLPSPLALNSGQFTGSLQNPPDLEANTRLIVTFDEFDNGKKYGVNWAFGHRSCMHCTTAACVEACPSSCLQKNEWGFIDYDPALCIGCEYCRGACPFDVPRHNNVGLLSADIKINKCDGCPDRIAHGMAPACVSTCQPEALKFGPRDEMLEIAHERVDWLKNRGYDDAFVYGETECGGTHMLQVLKYSIDHYGLPESPETQMQGLIGFMKPLAAVAGVGIVAGLGLCYARAFGYKRDDLAYSPETHELFDANTGEVKRTIDIEGGER